MKLWVIAYIISGTVLSSSPARAQYILLQGEPIPPRFLDPKVQQEYMKKPFDGKLFEEQLKLATEREKQRGQTPPQTQNKNTTETSPIWQRPTSTPKSKPGKTIFKKN